MCKERKNKLVFAFSSTLFFLSVMLMTFQISTTDVAAQTGCEDELYSEVCCGTDCILPDPEDLGYCNKGENDEYTCCYDNCS